MKKICPQCGKVFETKQMCKKFCSKACHDKADCERVKLSRGERKARRKRLAEERRRDMDMIRHPEVWMKRRGFIDG